MRSAPALVLVALVAASPAADAARRAKAAPKDDGPSITLEPLQHVDIGAGIVVEADIVDDDGVFEPKLFFRPVGDRKYFSLEMASTGGARFRAEIPASSVIGPMEYFVEAYDGQGNGPKRSAPPTRPHRVFPADPATDLSLLPPPPPPLPAVAARAPDIVHVPIERVPQGTAIPIEASFRGPSGVFNPMVFFRRVGTPAFTPLSMAELPIGPTTPRVDAPDAIVGAQGTGRWVAAIPSAFTTGDLEYYLEAMDAQGNGPAHHGDREHPHAIRTLEQAPPVVASGVDPEVALASCLALPREGETVDAEKLGPCRRSIAAATADAITRFTLGELKLRNEEHAEAVDAFDAAAKASPSWPAALFRLAQASEAKRDWPRAKDAYRRYLALTGTPPEYTALLKRIASVEYELSVEERARRENAVRAEAERRKEAELAREREQARVALERRRSRERLLSAPGQWSYATASRESFGRNASHADSVGFRFRGKIEGLEPLVFGGGLGVTGVHAARSVDDFTAHLSVSGLVGLNLLALPTPSASGFTLLSPFVAWQPRYFVGKPIPALEGTRVTHTLLVGNHFEVGGVSLEVAWGVPLGPRRPDRHVDVALGGRLGDDR